MRDATSRMTERFGHNRNIRAGRHRAAREEETMTPAVIDEGPELSAESFSAKRRQILEGARRVFLGAGFDAASMGEIAREAKVSKGTLYVYFDSKEALFAALIEQTKRDTAERMGELDPDDPDIAGVLVAHGTQLIEKLASPEHVAMVRMVIGAAEK